MRDRDTNANGTLDERRYYCQNWRADVSAIVTSGGHMTEWVKYSPFGIAFGLPGADTDSDGDCDATGISQINTWIAAASYDIRGDVDLDGDVDTTDKTIAQNNYQGTTSGWGVLSAQGNRKGYAGYEHDENISELTHVRNRVLHTTLGRWMRRDPLGYVDGMSLYEYVGSLPLIGLDPNGLKLPGAMSCDQFCDQRYRELMLENLKDLLRCIGYSVIPGVKPLAGCSALCGWVYAKFGPYAAAACFAACMGYDTGESIYEIGQCFKTHFHNRGMARHAFCLCLEWKKRHCVKSDWEYDDNGWCSPTHYPRVPIREKGEMYYVTLPTHGGHPLVDYNNNYYATSIISSFLSYSTGLR